ncbi:MAG TPA: primosomal protein N' [Terriglobia bacterium]|nr:primosomal protein N' [Terriglobia bacterium]
MDRKPHPKRANLVEIAVMAAIRNTLTYLVPDSFTVRPGQRVQVPLATRKATGIVLRAGSSLPPGIAARPILRLLDTEPVLTPELLELGLWIADYYVAPIGEVFRAMLPLRSATRRARLVRLSARGQQRLQEINQVKQEPAGPAGDLFNYLATRGSASVQVFRQKFPEAFLEALKEKWLVVDEVERERTQRQVYAVRLTGPVPEKPVRLSPVAKRILEALGAEGAAGDHRELLHTARADLAALKRLSASGLVELEPSKAERRSALQTQESSPSGDSWAEADSSLVLTSAQKVALDDLTKQLESGQFQTVLLHGVTGSGKTEVYLRLIARCLEIGRTALMLVPEIALTPSVQAQFLARFGLNVALLHSALSENERHEEWWRIRRGEAKVVLGTRSAIFAPLSNLGVVIVDEEHDTSYKQEETPRYHGRDVAVVRARLASALVLLGSATPSLESYWNAREGKYRLATLPERVEGRKLADVEIVDMRQEFRETHTQVPISRRLHREIETQLANGQQTMILLNRRGYSWFLLCRSCGQTERCVNCSISLTYHRREHRLICHYCGYSAPVPARCPNCDSQHLYYVGEGTEKVEKKFAELFPGARVARLDRDVARRQGQFQHILDEFRRGKIDILVGTQMIAKGHDFPGVTLVGVVSADIGLGMPDFRSAERTFQLLTQAAGRAGRGESPGRVLVQTFYPEHYAIRLAAEQNYEAFFDKEMRFRRMMHYPPVAALANVIAQGAKLEQAAQVAKHVGNFLIPLEKQAEGLKILGPTPAPLAKLEGRFRIQFLMKCTSRARLSAILQRLADYTDQQGIPQRSLMIDMDPANIM